MPSPVNRWGTSATAGALAPRRTAGSAVRAPCEARRCQARCSVVSPIHRPAASQKLERETCFDRCRSWRQVSEKYRAAEHPPTKMARSPSAAATTLRIDGAPRAEAAVIGPPPRGEGRDRVPRASPLASPRGLRHPRSPGARGPSLARPRSHPETPANPRPPDVCPGVRSGGSGPPTSGRPHRHT